LKLIESGRIGKWAMELSEHVVDFEKRSSIKLHVLSDFIADWTEPLSYTEGIVIDTPWQVHYVKAWGVSGARAAAIMMSPSGIKLRYAVRLQFIAETDKCSNNIAEYEAVLLGLCKPRAMGVQYCMLKTDSKVVASKIEKECMARDKHLKKYLAVIQRMENYFKEFTMEYIERIKNTEADELAKAATKKAVLPLDVFFQVIEDPSMPLAMCTVVALSVFASHSLVLDSLTATETQQGSCRRILMKQEYTSVHTYKLNLNETIITMLEI
jgi:ribonuclease HI